MKNISLLIGVFLIIFACSITDDNELPAPVDFSGIWSVAMFPLQTEITFNQIFGTDSHLTPGGEYDLPMEITFVVPETVAATISTPTVVKIDPSISATITSITANLQIGVGAAISEPNTTITVNEESLFYDIIPIEDNRTDLTITVATGIVNPDAKSKVKYEQWQMVAYTLQSDVSKWERLYTQKNDASPQVLIPSATPLVGTDYYTLIIINGLVKRKSHTIIEYLPTIAMTGGNISSLLVEDFNNVIEVQGK